MGAAVGRFWMTVALCLECSTIGLAVVNSRSDLTTEAPVRLVAGLDVEIRDALVYGRGPAPR